MTQNINLDKKIKMYLPLWQGSIKAIISGSDLAIEKYIVHNEFIENSNKLYIENSKDSELLTTLIKELENSNKIYKDKLLNLNKGLKNQLDKLDNILADILNNKNMNNGEIDLPKIHKNLTLSLNGILATNFDDSTIIKNSLEKIYLKFDDAYKILVKSNDNSEFTDSIIKKSKLFVDESKKQSKEIITIYNIISVYIELLNNSIVR